MQVLRNILSKLEAVVPAKCLHENLAITAPIVATKSLHPNIILLLKLCAFSSYISCKRERSLLDNSILENLAITAPNSAKAFACKHCFAIEIMCNFEIYFMKRKPSIPADCIFKNHPNCSSNFWKKASKQTFICL